MTRRRATLAGLVIAVLVLVAIHEEPDVVERGDTAALGACVRRFNAGAEVPARALREAVVETGEARCRVTFELAGGDTVIAFDVTAHGAVRRRDVQDAGVAAEPNATVDPSGELVLIGD